MGTPRAYLITFRTYGTWLHGDLRSSIDRDHNAYGMPPLRHDPVRKEYIRSKMAREPVLLDARRRTAVINAIRETCEKRSWDLMAINIRTNHAHSVVGIGTKEPELALSAFKANATREMREQGLWFSEKSPWAEKGSRRYLWTEVSVEAAIDYVINGQGDDLPFE